jgi:hypothetical protein
MLEKQVGSLPGPFYPLFEYGNNVSDKPIRWYFSCLDGFVVQYF